MKKIVALGAIAALAGGMIFADEPAIDIKVAELSGNAEVKWGVDLDAGQTGFENSEEANLKVNLWNEGTKETEGDGVWADIQVKGKSYAIKNGAFDGDGNASLERAKLHINDFYVDIRSGHTTVGEFKPDAAIHSDVAWLGAVGADFTQGIQAGYDTDAFKFSLDFRSWDAETTKFSNSYGIAFNAELKDNLVPGLSASVGVGTNLSTSYNKAAVSDKVHMPVLVTKADYDPADPDDDLVIDTADNVKDHLAQIYDFDDGKYLAQEIVDAYDGDGRMIAYGVKAAYKLGIGDDMFLKPSVGFTGYYSFGTQNKEAASLTENNLAVGVLFGWGEINKDAKCGVPYLDSDDTKKVTPGVSVVAYIPLPTVSTWKDTKKTELSTLQALIVPSFYLGEEKVSGLKAALYSEIGLFKYNDADAYDVKYGVGALKGSTEKDVTIQGTVNEKETFALALAAGLSYGIPVEEATITPKAGFRYVNGAYIANGLLTEVRGDSSEIFEKGLGLQRKADADDAEKKTWFADWFNLNIGCDFGGFINNTTFSVEYKSANLLNAITSSDDSDPAYVDGEKYYNVKAGTVKVGCKIAL